MVDAIEAIGGYSRGGNEDLTPQEEYLYRHHLDNLTGSGAVRNDDGSTSTIYNTTVEIDGRTYLIPTIWDGKTLSPDEAIARAEAVGFDKWPSYGTEDEASSRYDHLHGLMENDVRAFDNRTQGGM